MPTILSGDVPLHVQTDGDDRRPAVLLLNPLGTTMAVWEPYLDVLTAHHWVIRHDLRGHRADDAAVEPFGIGDLGRDVLAVMDALEIPRAHVMGASLGGMVAVWLAAEHPDRVDRLVLASTAPRLGPDRWWEQTIARVETDGLRPIAEHLESIFFSPEWLAAMPEDAEAARDMLLTIPISTYLEGARCILRTDIGPLLDGVRASTLVIAGEDDPVLAHHPAVDLLDRIPDAEAVEVGGARHRVLWEQPDALATVVSEFLTDPDAR